MAAQEIVLITGGQGFFGVWMCKQLLAEGAKPVVLDLQENNSIFSQVLSDDEIKKVERFYGDITDAKFVNQVVMDVKPTSIIHLAGLQIPTCRARPILGAQVNILGTINVFEAIKALKEATGNTAALVFASSAAVIGAREDYAVTPVPDETLHKPRTLYGVYKLCTEGIARIYWQDYSIPSVALRPYTCFGVGREIGVTSLPTKAIKAAVLGRPYEITFSGVTAFSYVVDIARIFIGCARAPLTNAYALNIRGTMESVDNFVKHIEKAVPSAAGTIAVSGNELSIMPDIDESGLAQLLATVPEKFNTFKNGTCTSNEAAVKEVVDQFTAMKEAGTLHDKDL